MNVEWTKQEIKSTKSMVKIQSDCEECCLGLTVYFFPFLFRLLSSGLVWFCFRIGSCGKSTIIRAMRIVVAKVWLTLGLIEKVKLNRISECIVTSSHLMSLNRQKKLLPKKKRSHTQILVFRRAIRWRKEITHLRFLTMMYSSACSYRPGG